MKDTFASRLMDYLLLMGLTCAFALIVPEQPEPQQACEACQNVRYEVADLEQRLAVTEQASGVCQ